MNVATSSGRLPRSRGGWRPRGAPGGRAARSGRRTIRAPRC